MIFTILKVIGIILLVVLALILTALLCVLFVPVKYRAVGSFDNTDIRAKAHVSWLFHLFALHIEYAQETDIHAAISSVNGSDSRQYVPSLMSVSYFLYVLICSRICCFSSSDKSAGFNS